MFTKILAFLTKILASKIKSLELGYIWNIEVVPYNTFLAESLAKEIVLKVFYLFTFQVFIVLSITDFVTSLVLK